jgi:hypothetical protein
VPSTAELKEDTLNSDVKNTATAFSSFLKLPAAAYKSLIQRILPPRVRTLFTISLLLLVTFIASLSAEFLAAPAPTHKKATDPRSLRSPLNPLRLPAAGNFRKLEKAVALLQHPINLSLIKVIKVINVLVIGQKMIAMIAMVHLE